MGIVVDVPLFRAQIPFFSDPLIYTDAAIEVNWDIATMYVSDNNCGFLKDKARAYVINLIAAHLFNLAEKIDEENGGSGNTFPVSSASEGTVSIGFDTPDAKNGLHFWLNQSPYGIEALALISMKGSIGLYVGGYPVASHYRKGNGRFG